MEVLAFYRTALNDHKKISKLAPGGAHVLVVPAETERPNILLELPECGQDYTHSGPDGLFDGHLKVSCRADDPETVSKLGETVRKFLAALKGQAHGIHVDLTEHFNTRADYSEKTSLYLHVSEYTTFFKETRDE